MLFIFKSDELTREKATGQAPALRAGDMVPPLHHTVPPLSTEPRVATKNPHT